MTGGAPDDAATGARPTPQALASDSWKAAVTGDWDVGSNWTLGVSPTLSTSATIAASGVYTVTIDTSVLTNALLFNDSFGTVSDTGTLSVATTLNINAGTFALSGSVVGGTVTVGSQGLLLATGGTLSGVTYDGPLNLGTNNESLTLAGGTSLTGSAGSGAGTLSLSGYNQSVVVSGALSSAVSINETGMYGTVTLFDTRTLSTGTLTLGDTQGYPSYLQVEDDTGRSATLTLASQYDVTQGGSVAEIQLLDLADTLVNLGSIGAAVSSGRIYLGTSAATGTIVNGGSIAVSNGDTLIVDAGTFLNSATASEKGKISVAGTGTILDFAGTIASPSLAGITVTSGGAVELSSVLQNTGTLAIGGTNALAEIILSNGTISGGTINDAGAGLVANGGTLINLFYESPLDLGTTNAALTLGGVVALKGAGGLGGGTLSLTGYNDSIAVSGALNSAAEINVVGDYGTLTLFDTRVLETGTLTLGNGQGYPDYLVIADTTGRGAELVLGSGFVISQGGAQSTITLANLGDSLLNFGTINAAVSSGHLYVGTSATVGTIANGGHILVSNADTLVLDAGGFLNDAVSAGKLYNGTVSVTGTGSILEFVGRIATASLAGITASSGGAVEISGSGLLANTGTLAVGGTAALSELVLNGGTISGGAVSDPGNGLVSFGGTLSAVAYRGALDLASNNETITLDGDSFAGAAGTGTGTLALTGYGVSTVVSGAFAGSVAITESGLYNTITFVDTRTLAAGTLTIGSTQGGTDYLAVADTTDHGATLTLGSGFTVNQGGVQTVFQLDDLADTLVNLGKINVFTSGARLYLGGSSTIGTIANGGSIAVSNGATLYVDAGTFLDSASSAAGATKGAVSVAGTGSMLGFLGTIASPELGGITEAGGGLVEIAGDLENSGTLAIGTGTSLATLLLLSGTISGGAVADHGDGLVTSGGTLLNVTYEGKLDLGSANESLVLSGSTDLTGTGGTGAGTLALDSSNSTLTVAGALTGAQSINEVGNYDTLTLENTRTLSSLVLTVGNSVGDPDYLRLADTSGRGATLTIGTGTRIELGGLDAQIQFDDRADTLVNLGAIEAGVSGGLLYLGTSSGTGTVTNGGSIAVSNGATVVIEATTFLDADGASAGHVSVTGTNSLLAFADRVTTAELAGITVTSGGAVEIDNFLQNNGTLGVGGTNALKLLALRGTIAGGHIEDPGAGLAGFGGTLVNLTYQGTLDLAQNNESLVLSGTDAFTGATGTGNGAIALTAENDSLVVSGAIAGTISADLSGMYDTLTLLNTRTLASGTLSIGNAQGYPDYVQLTDTMAQGATLTLGSGYMVDATGAIEYFLFNDPSGLKSELLNQGTIEASGAGSHFILGDGGSETVVNDGTITVGNGDTISIGDYFVNSGSVVLGTNADLILNSGGALGGQITGAGTLQLQGTNVFVLEPGLNLAVGTLQLDLGAVLSGVVVAGGNIIVVSSGGATAGATVGSVGTEIVSSSGTASTTMVSSGGTLIFAGGLVSSETFMSGATAVVRGGTVSGLASHRGVMVQVSSGGVAIGTTIDGTQVIYAGGATTSSTVDSGGANIVSSGGFASATQVSSGGTETVYAGGSSVAPVVNSGGSVVVKGGTVSGLASHRGAMIQIASGGSASFDTISGGTQTISSGGSAVATTLSSGGTETVLSGGHATSGTVDSGGMELIHGGSVSALASHRGVMSVYAGGSATSSFISGGTIIAGSGGADIGTTVSSGGTETLLQSGMSTDSIISSGGEELVSGGTAAFLTVLSGGSAVVTGGGTISDAVLSGGSATVSSGGSATSVTISSGGTETVLAGGFVLDTTVNSGGVQNVSGGTVSSTVVNGGGTQSLFGNTAIGTVAGSGTLALQSGSHALAGATLNVGTVTVASGATLTGTGTLTGALTVGSGGHIAGGAGKLAFLGPITNSGIINATSGGIYISSTVSGSGALQVGAAGTLSFGADANVASTQTVDFLASTGLVDLATPLNFNAHIVGFAGSDQIDLISSSATTFTVSSDTLTVLNGGTTVAVLVFSGTYGPGSFALASDGHGGELITFR
jgi:autotransporter passenger strand-loop-strand repeat protein